jgi:hypothetical protein
MCTCLFRYIYVDTYISIYLYTYIKGLAQDRPDADIAHELRVRFKTMEGIYVYIYIYICICIYMYKYLCIRMYVFIYVCTYAHTHIHIYSYITEQTNIKLI